MPRIIPDPEGFAQAEWEQTRLVSKDQRAPHQTIASAIESITDASTLKRYVIYVHPGDYIEENPLVLPDFVSLTAAARHEIVRIICVNANEHGIECGSDCDITGIQVRGASGVGKAGFLFGNAKQEVHLHDCKTLDCDISVLSESIGAGNYVREHSMTGGSGTDAIKATTGASVIVSDLQVTSAVTLTGAMIHGDGAGCRIIGNAMVLEGASVAVGVLAENGAHIEAEASHFEGVDIAIHTRTGGQIHGTGVEIDSSTTWDIFCEDVNDTIRVSGFTADVTKISINQAIPSSQRILSFVDIHPDDEGFTVLGEFHNGSPEHPSESCFGEGDSSTINMVLLNDDGTGTSFVNITDAIRAGTATNVFQGTAVGQRLLIGNTSRKFPGWKEFIGTAINLGSGALQVSLSTGAGTFAPVCIMTADSDTPREQYAQQLFERAQRSQVRLDPNEATWVTATYDSITAYWVEVEIITASISTIPQLSNPNGSAMKLHTNRFEINGDAFTERYGTGVALNYKLVHLPPHNTKTSGGSPKNVTISVSANISYSGSRNGYASGDGVVYNIPVPKGVSTDREWIFRSLWKPSSTNAGTPNLRLFVASGQEGNLVTGALTEIDVAPQITIVPSGVTNEIQAIVEHRFRLPNVLPGEVIWVSHQRVASGDTFTGDMEFLTRGLFAPFWS